MKHVKIKAVPHKGRWQEYSGTSGWSNGAGMGKHNFSDFGSGGSGRGSAATSGGDHGDFLNYFKTAHSV